MNKIDCEFDNYLEINFEEQRRVQGVLQHHHAMRQQAMHFIAQIDSFEDGHPDPQFMFGDVGMIYVWYCFKCGNAVASVESY